VYAFAIDPINSSTLYAGIRFGGGVFKSSDGGGSWTAANTGLTDMFVTSLAIDPITTRILYAGTFGGVFKSVDGGANWIAAAPGPTSLSVLVIDPATTATVYAGTAYGGAFKSGNGGGS